MSGPMLQAWAVQEKGQKAPKVLVSSGRLIQSLFSKDFKWDLRQVITS